LGIPVLGLSPSSGVSQIRKVHPTIHTLRHSNRYSKEVLHSFLSLTSGDRITKSGHALSSLVKLRNELSNTEIIAIISAHLSGALPCETAHVCFESSDS
jgi:hypothetical protein